jgi:DNA-binding transcriptional ArsR family regulator
MTRSRLTPAPARPTVAIRDTRQIAVLGSPARQEVVDALQALGPCSVAELAEALGRAPDSLYYHLRKLERAALVVRHGTRTSGAREETLYATPGVMVVDHEPGTARERANVLRLVGSALRIAERDLRTALGSGRAVYRRNAQRNAWGARTKGWLTRAELAEVRAHLAAVTDLLARGKKQPGAELHAVTFVLTPLVPSARSQAARSARKKRIRS